MNKGKKGSMLLLFISLLIPVASAYVYQHQSNSMIQNILNTRSYYDPSFDISIDWNVNGSGTHYEAIDEGIRNNSTPILMDYIFTSRKKNDVLGFPSINENDISSVILWVFSETGSNAETTINLLNNGTIQTTLIVNPGSSQGWRSAVWTNPSSIGSITVEFIHEKHGGGQSTDSIVYAVYLELILFL